MVEIELVILYSVVVWLDCLTLLLLLTMRIASTNILIIIKNRFIDPHKLDIIAHKNNDIE